jgi:hypothetical protein
VVGEVGVHLEERAVPPRVGEAALEGGDHGRAPSALLVPDKKVDATRVLRNRLADDIARAVGASVVGDADVQRLRLGQKLADEASRVLALVVGRDDYEDAVGDPVPPSDKP